jgi:penicillin-binding protein activator
MKPFAIALIPALALGALALPGCGGKTITRTESGAAKDLSGKWNDVDTKNTASEIVQKALKAPWPDRFQEQNKRNPVIAIGKFPVRTNGDEHINTSLITNALIEEFLNSGKIDVLSDPEETRKILEDQAAYAEKSKELGKEAAADFVLNGEIGVQNDQEGRESVKFYVVSFKLTDVQSRKLVWQSSNTPIRKEIEQSRWK